jgi:hypothetical protein
MRFTIDVTPGDHTTETGLVALAESIRLVLSQAVDHVAGGLFPEYAFDFYPDPTGTEQNTGEPAGTTLLRELRTRRGIDS